MSKLLLESARLENLCAHYPDRIKEATLWLAGYLISNCNRSADILEAHTRKLGFTTTLSTYVKILRGQWNRTADGAETSPIISERNFSAIIEALRREHRLAGLSGAIPFVEETTTYKRIAAFIDKKRSPLAVCKFGIIIGHTGTGKSASFKHYSQLNNHGQVAHLESPYVPSVCKLVTKLAAAYGVSVFLSSEIKLNRITENLNDRKTLILDNAQRLYLPNRGSNQPAFNYLQEIQDDTNCTIILSITPEFERTLGHGLLSGYFEQFEGRAGGRANFLHLDPCPPAEDVIAIATAFGLKDPDDHARFLTDIASKPGRIRILFDVLQDAKREADSKNQQLTIKHVKEAAAGEIRPLKPAAVNN